MRNSGVRIWIAALAGLAAATSAAFAQGDGARAYQLLPEGTDMASVMYLQLNGNSTGDPGAVFQGVDAQVDVAAFQYTHTIDIAGQQAGLFAVIPTGTVDATFRLLPGDQRGVSQGLGDVVLGGVFGIYNSPSMPMPEYAAFRPGLSAGALVKFGLPTGAYDPDKLINLGANRTWMQVGLPAGYTIGKSFFDPHLTTLEVLPSLVVYGDNVDPFGPANTTGQAPLAMLEAHATHNLSQAVWVSVDALWEYGGETSTNGAWNGDTQRAFGMGLTGFIATGNTSGLKISYGETLSANKYGANGSMVRLIWAVLF